MPLVRVEILKGQTAEHKKAILDAIHNALVEAFKIPDHDRNQKLYELDPEWFERSPGKSGLSDGGLRGFVCAGVPGAGDPGFSRKDL